MSNAILDYKTDKLEEIQSAPYLVASVWGRL